MIEWNKIVNNSLSMLVAAVFVGAAAILWNQAMSIDTKITDATETLRQQADYMGEAVELLQNEIVELRKQNNELLDYVDAVRKMREKENPGGKSGEFEGLHRPDDFEIPEDNFIQQRLPNMPLLPRSR